MGLSNSGPHVRAVNRHRSTAPGLHVTTGQRLLGTPSSKNYCSVRYSLTVKFCFADSNHCDSAHT